MEMATLFRKFVICLSIGTILEHDGVHGYDIVFNNCDTVSDGESKTFEATLFKANLSVCDLFATTKVTFQLKYPTAVTENLCEQLLSPCDPAPNAEGCRCVSEGQDAYIFEFSFTLNKSKYNGSTLDLIPDCVSSNPNGLIRRPCELIIEDTSPATPPNATTDSPGTTTASSESPSSPTATGSPTTTSTGDSSTSGPAIPPHRK